MIMDGGIVVGVGRGEGGKKDERGSKAERRKSKGVVQKKKEKEKECF